MRFAMNICLCVRYVEVCIYAVRERRKLTTYNMPASYCKLIDEPALAKHVQVT